ncbi:MAG: endonuclease/exonuclease/phosphatase family protein [Actinomycetota bacterium]|nr:endonuclease/exonuclease/phosphatase family protein [Actinomycetota bacterium]
MAVAKPPAKVVKECQTLAAGLDEVIPAKHLDRNLLIGTWNIRAFGDLADTWTGNGDGNVKRDLRALAHITELVSRFDVVAVQEVKDNLRALRHMMKALGPEWGFILTDTTRGDAGNDERLAFVFDLRRVKPSGLACELVLDDKELGMAGAGEMAKQFARTPYAVSFQSADQTFILVTLHVLWGKVPGDRIPELKRIAKWVADWADEIQSWGQNLIVLGDFNIDRKDDAAYEAFTSSGLRPPDALNDIPRTLFGQEKKAFYDQIAWFVDEGGPRLTLEYTGRAGGFDFQPFVLTEMSAKDVSWRMSDHLPLWCEFGMTRVGSIKAPAKPAPIAAARKRKPKG